MSEGAFFHDLAVLMVAGGLVSAIFARFKWPKVIGYILAGILMSEHTWGGSFLRDPTSVNTIGQLGVVFLMFAMGLDFSVRDMKRLKNVTIPTALIDTILMTWLGYTFGTKILGWGSVPSLFLGAAVCDSATTMLAKVIDELKWGARPFVKYSLGSSVCEDIICVGIISVITGVASGKGMSVKAAAESLGGLLVFFAAVIIIGFVLVPRLLKSLAKRKDSEVLLLVILAFLFFVSFIADRFQFSLALGAFLVGIIGSASDVKHRLVELSQPLRSMFAAVFFVSIGLLVNPSECWAQWPTILALTAVVVGGKFVNCTLGGLLSGETVKTSVQMGMSLAQIGEFAYMVAMLYITTTHDTASPIYQIVVAVSLLTTLLNPFMIRASEPIGGWIEAHLPKRAASLLATYRGAVEKYRSVKTESEGKRAVRSAVVRLAVIAVLIFAVSVACGKLYELDYSNFSKFFEAHDQVIFFGLANLFAWAMLPMIWKLATTLGTAMAQVIVRGETGWALAVRKWIVNFSRIGVIAVFFIELTMLNVSLTRLTPENGWVLGGVSIFVMALGIVGWRRFTKFGERSTIRITEALDAETRQKELQELLELKPTESGLVRLKLDAASTAVGGNVVTLNIRAKTGASVVSIKRGEEMIHNIGPETDFAVGDILYVSGNSSQIAALKDLLAITAVSA